MRDKYVIVGIGLTNVVGCPPDHVSCEMPVEVTWEYVTEEFSLPKFKPL